MKKVHFRGFKLIRLKVNQNSTASPQSNQRARNEPQRAFYWNGSKDGWHQCHLVILNWNYNSKLQTDHKRFSRQSTFQCFYFHTCLKFSTVENATIASGSASCKVARFIKPGTSNQLFSTAAKRWIWERFTSQYL